MDLTIMQGRASFLPGLGGEALLPVALLAVEPADGHRAGRGDGTGDEHAVDTPEVVEENGQHQAEDDAVDKGVPHHEHGVAAAGGQGVVGEEAGVEQLADDLDAQVDDGPLLHLGVGGEDGDQDGGQQLRQDDEYRRHGEGDLHAGAHDLPGAVVEAGAQVLGHHGGGGARHGGDEQLAEILDLVAHAVGGGVDDGDGAVAVDQVGHHQPGHAGNGPLEGGGQAQAQDGPHPLTHGLEVLHGHAQVLPVPQAEEQGGEEGDELGDDGGQGGALHAHVKAGPKNQVQHHVGGGGGDDENQRHLGVAHSPQHGGQGVVAEDGQQAHRADLEVGCGLVQGRSLEQDEQLPGKNGKQRGGDHAHQDGQGEQGAG